VNSRPGSRSESRALSLPNAQSSHDFFEAVFIYGNPGGQTIARATWEIGESPQLRGVHRTSAGIDYGFVTNAGRTGNEGAAVLFVGTKADKTLLALGRLVEVNGSTGTTINSNTVSVTFEVAALKAGVSSSPSNPSNSFFTNYLRGSNSGTESNIDAANTLIENNIYIHYAGKKLYPLFKINNTHDASNGGGNPVTWGRYNFAVESSPGAVKPTYFDDYKTGIVLAGGYNCETRNPRYPITNGLYQYSSFLVQDIKTTVQLESPNNAKINPPYPPGQVGAYDPVNSPSMFANPVRFRFNNTLRLDLDENGYVFALVFEIFVYNLTAGRTSTQSVIFGIDGKPINESPVKWRISPGYGEKWLDLDDGTSGEGGAIFIGSGNVFQWLPANL